MIRLEDKISAMQIDGVDTTLTLDFDARQKSRQRVQLDDGSDAGVMLARGTILADGDVLRDAEGTFFVRVVAAPEALSYVHCHDRLLLNRICYHLGNRHVPLQVTCEAVAYRHDHVLDAMVAGLGVVPKQCCCAFHPEPGAYDGHGHGHGHGHEHGHEHGTSSRGHADGTADVADHAADAASTDDLPVRRAAHG
ncbi:urease accessory protein UreE [Salinisphaera sp. Q1T1-3]|uniref:urease accessory protein UreE n=1 Tax=Salinisphaera sp. Q1T1-3 TaxID=2321229 RepID=UPI000E734D97|nr:urease accessory protein UreE [Salinisphaera sp. Q1T1-3]RJS94258.1 urease accessory protein UreE [Salinisphaera sp. Q1T1-3]